MIKSKNGEVNIKGKPSKVLADLTIAVIAVREHLKECGKSEEQANAMIAQSITMGLAMKPIPEVNDED